MAQRSRLRGDKGFRKIIRQLPDAARNEMAEVMQGLGSELAQAMKRDAPRKTGELQSGVSYKLAKRSLKLRVGLVGTPRGRAKLFYGWIVELGRKAQVVNVTRRRNTKPYRLRVKAMAPRPFVFKRRDDLRRDIGQRLRNYWNNVLIAAANGATFDD